MDHKYIKVKRDEHKTDLKLTSFSSVFLEKYVIKWWNFILNFICDNVADLKTDPVCFRIEMEDKNQIYCSYGIINDYLRPYYNICLTERNKYLDKWIIVKIARLQDLKIKINPNISRNLRRGSKMTEPSQRKFKQNTSDKEYLKSILVIPDILKPGNIQVLKLRKSKGNIIKYWDLVMATLQQGSSTFSIFDYKECKDFKSCVEFVNEYLKPHYVLKYSDILDYRNESDGVRVNIEIL